MKIRGTDEHGEFAGTGFFIDPAGTLYTAFSVGGDADNLTVEFDGKKYPARVMMADVRSGIAILKADIATPPCPSASPSNSRWRRPLSRLVIRSIFRRRPVLG